MKKFMLSSVITVLFVSQFLSLQVARAELLYPVEIDYQPVQVRISRIKIQQDGEQLILSGLIKRRSYNSHVLPGHIDYSIIDGKGQLIKEGMTNYSPSLSLRRWKYGSHFSFSLSKNLPEGSTIKLGWHQNHSKKHISSALNLKNNLLL